MKILILVLLLNVDSTMLALNENNERDNASMLLRLKQSELALQQERLLIEEQRRSNFIKSVWILSVAFVLITVLLVYIIIIYRSRNAALRALVKKWQQWAQGQYEINDM